MYCRCPQAATSSVARRASAAHVLRPVGGSQDGAYGRYLLTVMIGESGIAGVLFFLFGGTDELNHKDDKTQQGHRDHTCANDGDFGSNPLHHDCESSMDTTARKQWLFRAVLREPPPQRSTARDGGDAREMPSVMPAEEAGSKYGPRQRFDSSKLRPKSFFGIKKISNYGIFSGVYLNPFRTGS